MFGNALIDGRRAGGITARQTAPNQRVFINESPVFTNEAFAIVWEAQIELFGTVVCTEWERRSHSIGCHVVS